MRCEGEKKSGWRHSRRMSSSTSAGQADRAQFCRFLSRIFPPTHIGRQMEPTWSCGLPRLFAPASLGCSARNMGARSKDSGTGLIPSEAVIWVVLLVSGDLTSSWSL